MITKTVELKMPEEQCRRKIVYKGKVEEIVADYHSFAWSGKIPCTGVYRCIYCGIDHNDYNQLKHKRSHTEDKKF